MINQLMATSFLHQRVIFDQDYWPSVYSTTPPSPHKLAVVYLVMALGVMFDLERREPSESTAYISYVGCAPTSFVPADDPLAAELFRLGCACLTANGGLSRPSVPTVQALNLIGNFMLNDRSANGANAFWPILGLAQNTVTAIGLHRDGTNFDGLSPYEIEERRKVFWEMLTLDRLQAMCFARPSALPNRSIDTLFPGVDILQPEERLRDDDRYHDCKYRLVALMDKIIEEQTRTTKGSYSKVLAIDQEILEFRANLPESMEPKLKASSLSMEPDLHPHTVLHRLSIRLLVMETRIYLHRSYFTKALEEVSRSPTPHLGLDCILTSALTGSGRPFKYQEEVPQILPGHLRVSCGVDQYRPANGHLSSLAGRQVVVLLV